MQALVEIATGLAEIESRTGRQESTAIAYVTSSAAIH